MKCPECGEIILKGQALCPNCHFNLAVPVEENSSEQPAQGQVTPANDDKAPKPHKSNAMAWVLSILAAIIIIGVVVFYVNKNNQDVTEEEAYTELSNLTDTAAYRQFLDKYPNSEHREDVQDRLNKLVSEINDWNRVYTSCSSADFEQFLSTYPNSKHARECADKIDSLDWITATKANTPDAFQAYLAKHPTGKYIDQAQQQQQNIAKTEVTPEDKQLIKNVFSNYFSSLQMQDETGVCSALAPILNSFLNKRSATKSDVLAYMHHIFANGTTITFTPNNDYRITKKATSDGEFQYTVSFTVDENINKDGKSSLTTYSISGSVTTDGKISMLNMRQLTKPAE
jgi:hypothetical protein